MNKIDFKEMKSKVGIDDVAYRLGYRIDKKAGMGRYVEMINPQTNDKIIIKNPQDKALQTFFRRDGRKGGDVITFIQSNLAALGQGGRNQWEAVVRVLADFSNTYIQESSKYLENVGYKGSQPFNPSRFDVQAIETDLSSVIRFLSTRGLNMDTLTAFSASIVRIKDTYNTHYDGYNLAFPYTRPHDNEVVGYEVRGHNGFKSKAAGTDSSNAAWIVDLSNDKNPLTKKHVFFMESAFDVMAFYQANKNKLNLEDSVFVSIGGTFSDNQIRSIMNYYKNATAVDCYDNDISGTIYGLRMLAVLNDKKIETSRPLADYVSLSINGAGRLYKEKDLTPSNIAREFYLKIPVLTWKAPPRFKDWNDAVQNKSITEISKYQKERNLQKRRQMKI